MAMIQFCTVREITGYLKEKQKQGLVIGFVPTMGALHEGHLALVRRSKQENDLTVCSIFVNPIQFNNKEDLEKYPRDLAGDFRMLEETGCDLLFSPENKEMYPDGQPEALDLDFGLLDKIMEGKFRPGHFQGVATVVKKLFGIVHPTRAYFGKKDFQQLAVIRHLVHSLKIPVTIVPCETVREPDGLAMSSRNRRLTANERPIAPIIYQVLSQVKEKVGKIPVAELKEWALAQLSQNGQMQVEYFEICDTNRLLPIENWNQTGQAVALTAVCLGSVRLIDNIELFS